MEADNDTPDEGFELRIDGTVDFWTDDGQRWKLRRPKFGELRKLREQKQSIDDASYRLTTQIQHSVAAIKAFGEKAAETDPDEVATQVVAERDQIRAKTAEVEGLNLAWMRHAFELLGDHPLPPEDELPGWMVESSLIIGEFMAHWRNRPLALGGD